MLSSSTPLQLLESEFHVVRALTEKAFDDKASDIRVTDSKFLSEECNVRTGVYAYTAEIAQPIEQKQWLQCKIRGGETLYSGLGP